MKLAAQVLMIAAGLAVLAVSTRKPLDPKKEDPALMQVGPDAWFV